LLLRQLRYFAAVAEQGSVIRAATTLRLAQPALSRQLHSLENSVGVPLLERESRGVRVTPAGNILLATIKPVFERLDDAMRRVHLASVGRLGTLRLGIGRGAIDSSRVGRAVMALREHFPDVQLVVSEVGSALQAEKLRAGELDLAIGLDGMGDASLSTSPLFEFRIDSVILSSNHPLAGARSIRPAQLRGERLLMVDPLVTGPYPHLYQELRRLGITEWEAYPSVESVYSRVAAGNGWTVAPGTLITNAPPGTAVVPLTGLSVPMTIALRWRLGDSSPLIATVAPFLRRASGDGKAARVTSPSEKTGAPRAAGGVPAGLDVHHLRALLVTAEQGSLSRGAERLGLTQSGLSRQIRSLERELGVPLLLRRPNGVVPTAAGQVLREEAQRVLALVQDAIAKTRGTANGATVRCTIAAVAAEFSGEILVEAMKYVSAHHPDIAIEVTEMLTPQQVLALRERRIDLGIAGANAGVMDDPLISGVRLAEDVIECALVSDGHPLASRNWLKPSDLHDYPFLFIDRATYPKFYDVVMHTFDAIGLAPRMNGAFNGPRALWRSAAESLGWTLGSRSMRVKPLAGMVAVPIEGLHIPSGLQLLWRKDESNAAVLAVLEAFRQLPSSDAQAMGGAAPS
jgi:DNA-binding transcriptional LysR family regulator